MDEYGVFNDDEGCCQRGFASEGDAEQVRAEQYADRDCVVRQCCPQHPDHPYVTCPECD